MERPRFKTTDVKVVIWSVVENPIVRLETCVWGWGGLTNLSYLNDWSTQLHDHAERIQVTFGG